LATSVVSAACPQRWVAERLAALARRVTFHVYTPGALTRTVGVRFQPLVTCKLCVRTRNLGPQVAASREVNGP